MSNKRGEKPLGRKAYGSIPHLPGSKRGPGDHGVSEDQARIATECARDKNDRIIVQEKLDGSNVSVAKLEGQLFPLTRSGYLAETSPFEQHRVFERWARGFHAWFDRLLDEGERACGEWLYQAHGTRYQLDHAPFVLFDIITQAQERLPHDELIGRIVTRSALFSTPYVVSSGVPAPVKEVLKLLGRQGRHGALERIEGAVWRVERFDTKTGLWKVDFLCKYVHPHKATGKYLPDVEGSVSEKPVLNTWPEWASVPEVTA